MNEFSFSTLDFKKPKDHLDSLETPLGTRTVGDSVSYCNRCGLCLQNCPFYFLTQEEPLSPRGKNQAVRLLLERKLNAARNHEGLLRMATSCALCGRCTRACPGQIPTPQHILELRRLLAAPLLPHSLQRLMELRTSNTSLFYKIARTGVVLRRLGAVKLMRFSGLANLLGLSWLHRADRMIPPSTRQDRKAWKRFCRTKEEKPTLVYIPSLETELFLPQIGVSVMKAVVQKYRPAVWTQTPTGLFEYVYGNVRKARKQLDQLITRHAQLQNGTLPVLTDSLDVYNFLKQGASLFEEYPHLKAQALAFAKKVIFVTDILPKKMDLPALSLPVTLDASALFSTEEKPRLTAEKKLDTLFRKNFVHCSDRQADLPAFGYGFVAQNKAAPLQDLSLRPPLEKGVKTVIVLSGWARMEVYAARKRGSSLQAIHIAELNG